MSNESPLSKRGGGLLIGFYRISGGEAPKVKDCPNDIEVTGRNGTSIMWTEPIFTDNVRVTRIRSNEVSVNCKALNFLTTFDHIPIVECVSRSLRRMLVGELRPTGHSIDFAPPCLYESVGAGA